MIGTSTIPIPEEVRSPRPEAVLSFIEEKWGHRYKLQDSALELLFNRSENTVGEKVLLKVAALNDFYGTRIKDTYTVAMHIIGLKDFDLRLQRKDLGLVNDLATVKFPKDKGATRLYSFASKYCSHHALEEFPIYDYYVAEMLLYYREQERIAFEKEDLRNYPKFVEIIRTFRTSCGLGDLTLRKTDCFLWLAGREFRPKKFPAKKLRASG